MMANRTCIVRLALIAAAMACLPASAQTGSKWWRDGSSTAYDFPATLVVCRALSTQASGDDEIGCAISAVLAGRTALARDYFLGVTDANARVCLAQLAKIGGNAAAPRVLMAAYCDAKMGKFSDSRRLLESLSMPAVSSSKTPNVAMRFEAFRTAVLAESLNGEGESEAAIELILKHPQFSASEVLQTALFEIYVQDDRRAALMAWATNTSDPVLRALYRAQIELVRGSADSARRALEALETVSVAANQDGSIALAVARYRVTQITGHSSRSNGKDGKSGMFVGETATVGDQGIQVTNGLSLSLQYKNQNWELGAKGIDFKIDKDKLIRPGIALPIGFFY
jgi:hypothetical protein